MSRAIADHVNEWIAPGNVIRADDWAAANRKAILASLRDTGHLLLRGFGISDPSTFEGLVGELVDEWMDYRDRASKRSPIAGRVMTSTDTPAAFTIHQHCESSFTTRWPRHIFFWCDTPADTGGRTPITDMRAVTGSLDPALVDRFERTGVMYVRNFSAGGAGVGMDWRDVFQVDSRAQLDDYCRRAGIRADWHSDGRLRTTQVRPAIATHPQTHEPLWFNHIVALHASALDEQLREGLLRQVGEAGLPNNVYYGDGTPIAEGDITHIRATYAQHTRHFDWRAGDVLLLDNMLSAHGREPFQGARRVCTLMANPLTREASGQAVPIAEAQTRERVATAGTPEPTLAAGEDVRAWLVEAVARELEIETAAHSDNFEDLGGDSLSAVAIVDELYERFGIDLALETLMEAATLADVAREIETLA